MTSRPSVALLLLLVASTAEARPAAPRKASPSARAVAKKGAPAKKQGVTKTSDLPPLPPPPAILPIEDADETPTIADAEPPPYPTAPNGLTPAAPPAPTFAPQVLAPTAGKPTFSIPVLRQPPPGDLGPAFRYGTMTKEQCLQEAQSRKIPLTNVDSARGVVAPVRLSGPVGGVSYHSGLPAKDRPTSIYEIFDCRQVLALDDWSKLLVTHNVVEVIHMSAYRPPAKNWPEDKPGPRHSGAMAIDVGTLVKKDGSKLSVEKDFHGRIGGALCTSGAGPNPATPEAQELWALACETANARIFNVELTPNFNYPHRNHFHLEVSQTPKWYYLR